jgi:hypothetical protein
MDLTKQMKIIFKELKYLIKNTIIYDIESAKLYDTGDIEIIISFGIHDDNKLGERKYLFTAYGNVISDDIIDS